MPNDLRAILFDAGNTLVFVQPERALDILGPFGVTARPSDFDAAEGAQLAAAAARTGVAGLGHAQRRVGLDLGVAGQVHAGVVGVGCVGAATRS